MLRRSLSLIAAGATAGILLTGLTATTAAAAPTPAVAPTAITTLTYDDSLAGEFKTVVASGVAIWNAAVPNVRIVKATTGQRINIRVIADDGWPRATLGPIRPTGQGVVYMGRQAVRQGYNPTRIASHELGHILGLPDRRTGLCSDLMSGSSAPVSCTNAQPNATERARVQSNYPAAFVGAPTKAA